MDTTRSTEAQSEPYRRRSRGMRGLYIVSCLSSHQILATPLSVVAIAATATVLLYVSCKLKVDVPLPRVNGVWTVGPITRHDGRDLHVYVRNTVDASNAAALAAQH